MAKPNIAFIPEALLLPSALRKPAPPEPEAPSEAVVNLETSDMAGIRIDPETGAIEIDDDDGGVIINLNPNSMDREDDGEGDFNENLAERIDPGELSAIASDLLTRIQFDEMSRREWLETRAQGIRILGLKIEPPKSSIDSTASLDGMSNVRHPMLLEAVLRFQANARGELLPSDGPVKVANKLGEDGEGDEEAEQLEDDLNYYLTTVATEYYPDTDRMLLLTGLGGDGFKKVYNCPIRQRPVSESVDAQHLIIANAATDIRNSGRHTHVIQMRQSVLRRMQYLGAYRDVPIPAPSGVVPNTVDREIASQQGVDAVTMQQTEDRDHTIMEVYCELDLRQFPDRDEDGRVTGLMLPYRVAIEKDSQIVLEIRRNWKKDDETKQARIGFVKFPYVPGLGFYDIGLVHILGNTTNALTAAWREMLDAGMFANFPGFLIAKLGTRQNTNEMRIPPGGSFPVETDGMDINKAVMPIPYKDVSVAFAQFINSIETTAQRVGGTSEIEVAEGRQDAPVGTTLALIEQATKVEGSVHKRLHSAQGEEFQMLKECFRENPEAFLRAVKAKGKNAGEWNEEKFLAALERADLVPQADPNTPSHMHRLMKAMALIQLDKGYPGMFDGRKLLKRVLTMIKVDDADSLLTPEGGPPPGMPPEMQVKLAELQDRAQERAQRPMIQQMKDASEARQFQHEDQMQQRESFDQAADRQNRLQIAQLGFRESLLDNRAQVQSEAMRAGVEREELQSEDKRSDNEVKIAAHGVTVAKHGVTEAKHKATGDAAKARAAAKKPATNKGTKK